VKTITFSNLFQTVSNIATDIFKSGLHSVHSVLLFKPVSTYKI